MKSTQVLKYGDFLKKIEVVSLPAMASTDEGFVTVDGRLTFNEFMSWSTGCMESFEPRSAVK